MIDDYSLHRAFEAKRWFPNETGVYVTALPIRFPYLCALMVDGAKWWEIKAAVRELTGQIPQHPDIWYLLVPDVNWNIVLRGRP